VKIGKGLLAVGYAAIGVLASTILSTLLAVYGAALMFLPVVLFYLMFDIPLPWFTKIVTGAAAAVLLVVMLFRTCKVLFGKSSNEAKSPHEAKGEA
jgi:ABC-type phosphate transport system permease subunit